MLLIVLFWLFIMIASWLLFAVMFGIWEWMLQTGDDHNAFPKEWAILFITTIFITFIIKLQIR